MTIVGIFSFNKGKETVNKEYPQLLKEVERAISRVSAQKAKVKVSKEKTMRGKMLFDPKALNKAFKEEFGSLGWRSVRVRCDYPTQYYTSDFKPADLNKGAFREMDFIKDNLGIEVQFGKYAFMVYNVCAKMTIFNKLGYIKAGVEIVPVKQFAEEMSSGVSYFEQFVWDLEQRGVSDIDIPVLILGIDK